MSFATNEEEIKYELTKCGSLHELVDIMESPYFDKDIHKDLALEKFNEFLNSK